MTAQGSEPSERSPWARPPDAADGDAGPGQPAAGDAPAWQPHDPATGVPPAAPGWTAPAQPGAASWGAPRTGQDAAAGPAAGPAQGGGYPPPTAGARQHCYRHPNREAFVSCQRCGRAICPDCMRPASVGFQCPEEGGAVARAPRTALGGRADQASSGIVTKVLIGLCVLGYVLEGLPGLTLGNGRVNSFTERFALLGTGIAEHHQYYRLLTAAFLHANLLHIALNMYALYLMGIALEAMLGRVRYVALFVVCAVGGSTLSYLVNGLNVFSVGASTAIFGFFSCYYLLARRLRINTNQILVVVGINLALTFAWSAIDKWGHIGGLVTGLAMGLVFAYIPPRRAGLQAFAAVGIFALLIIAAVLKTQSIGTITGG